MVIMYTVDGSSGLVKHLQGLWKKQSPGRDGKQLCQTKSVFKENEWKVVFTNFSTNPLISFLEKYMSLLVVEYCLLQGLEGVLLC